MDKILVNETIDLEFAIKYFPESEKDNVDYSAEIKECVQNYRHY